LGRKRYLLDSSVYIAAIRDKSKAREIADFSLAFGPYVYLSSVVAQELLVGVNPTRNARKQIETAVIRLFERTGRIITPSHAAWRASANAIAKINRQVRRDTGEPVRDSLWNDALIAASSREYGITVVTWNAGDFERLSHEMKFSYQDYLPTW
jgi:predicted nucleic acid-binding protein